VSLREELWPWDSQPEEEAAGIDFASPLASGLVSAWRINGAYWYGPAGGTYSAYIGNADKISVYGRGRGDFNLNSSDAQAGRLPDGSYGTSAAGTFVACVTIPNRSDNRTLRGGATNEMQIRFAGGANLAFVKRAVSTRITATGVVAPLENCVIAGSYGSSNRLYKNGILLGSDTGNLVTVQGAPSWVGHDGVGTEDWDTGGAIYFIGNWSRQLSDSEVGEISRNPWQLFEPRRIFVPVAAAGGGTAAITAAAGAATASSLAGASTAASAATSAAGAATASTLAGAATAASALTSAAGSATASSLAGAAVAATAVTSAAGAATASTVAASSTASAAITQADGAAAAGTLTGVAGSGSTITAAAGASTASTLAGSSAAASAITAATGAATASAVAGASTAAATITAAAGAATASTLTGSVAGDASAITTAAGSASAQIIVGASFAQAAITAAAGAASASILVPVDAPGTYLRTPAALLLAGRQRQPTLSLSRPVRGVGSILKES